MKEQPKTKQMEAIQLQIEKLREQTGKAYAEMKKLVEKRNQLNEKNKQSRQEVTLLRNERDNLNEKVKLLKQQRDFVRGKTKEITDQIKEIDQKIAELKKKAPKINPRGLQEELDAIEWKIQTTSLDLDEEKRLIENVKQLETQLSAFKKIDGKNKKIKELLNERRALDVQANAFHNELTDLAKKSQELHLKIGEKLKITKESRAEADSLHQAYVKVKEQTAPLYDEIKRLTEQMRSIKVSLNDQDKTKRMLTEQALKEKLGSEAKEKLERGEELSWNEFQLLLGDDREDDSET